MSTATPIPRPKKKGCDNTVSGLRKRRRPFTVDPSDRTGSSAPTSPPIQPQRSYSLPSDTQLSENEDEPASENMRTSSEVLTDPDASLFTATQQPTEMLRCSFIKAKRLGAKPWLQDELHYTYKRRGNGRLDTTTYYYCSEKWTLNCSAVAVYLSGAVGFIRTKGIYFILRPH